MTFQEEGTVYIYKYEGMRTVYWEAINSMSGIWSV